MTTYFCKITVVVDDDDDEMDADEIREAALTLASEGGGMFEYDEG
jgi:hypothetical protein